LTPWRRYTGALAYALRLALADERAWALGLDDIDGLDDLNMAALLDVLDHLAAFGMQIFFCTVNERLYLSVLRREWKRGLTGLRLIGMGEAGPLEVVVDRNDDSKVGTG